jgi:hypothetical protein
MDYHLIGLAEVAEYLGLVSRGERPANRMRSFFGPDGSRTSRMSGSAGRTA